MFSRCLGFNATLFAIHVRPEAFDQVRCLFGPQPVTEKTILSRILVLAGVPEERIDDLEERLRVRTGIGFDRRNPSEWARSVKVPTMIYQVHDDVLTKPEDVRTIFDSIPTPQKKLMWIHGTSVRWDGYLEFQRRPEPMLEWLATYMP